MSGKAETPSYRLAAFLVTRGVRFMGTKQRGPQTIFILEGGDSTNQLIDEYPNSPERTYDDKCKSMHELTQVRRIES